jgi:hypothetical protein
LQNGVWSDALNQQALQWLEIMENMESAQDPLAKWFYYTLPVFVIDQVSSVFSHLMAIILQPVDTHLAT